MKVSGQAMNVVYELLKAAPPEVLKRLWEEADPFTPEGALLRHQLMVTAERRAKGVW